MYNDPSLTNFVVSENHEIEIDLGDLTNFPNGTLAHYTATLLVASKTIESIVTLITAVNQQGKLATSWGLIKSKYGQ